MNDRLPWAKFVWAHWETDPALMLCSMGAQGFWMRLLCLASKEGGYVRVGGVSPSPEKLAKIVRAAPEEVESWLSELEAEGVFSRTGRGEIYSRRMIKDARNSKQNSENGKKGGNPNIRKDEGNSSSLNPSDNPPVEDGVKADKEKEEEKEKERNPSGKEAPPLASPKPRGSRLSTDWQPTDIDRAFALKQGFTPAFVERMAERFRNHWTAATGKNATKIDWPATWRNWVLNEFERRPPRTEAPQQVDWIG